MSEFNKNLLIVGVVAQQTVHAAGGTGTMNYQSAPMSYQQSLAFQQSGAAQGYPSAQRQACAAAGAFYAQQPGSCSLARLQQMAEGGGGTGGASTPPHQGPTPPAPPGTPHYHKYYSQSPGQIPGPDPSAAARNSRNIPGSLLT